MSMSAGVVFSYMALMGLDRIQLEITTWIQKHFVVIKAQRNLSWTMVMHVQALLNSKETYHFVAAYYPQFHI